MFYNGNELMGTYKNRKIIEFPKMENTGVF